MKNVATGAGHVGLADAYGPCLEPVCEKVHTRDIILEIR